MGQFLDICCAELKAAEADLNALDAKSGDGDTGSTVATAADALLAARDRLPLADRASLCRAVAAMKTADEAEALLADLCTPAELEAMVDRWRVVRRLANGETYRDIHDHTGVSVTTVGRVARFLQMGEGGYQLALKRLNLPMGAIKNERSA